MFSRIALAAVIVFACSVDVKAQQPGQYRGQVISNRVIVNNTYAGGGWNRGGNWNYNCTGCFPGAGPYDSTIAVAGIAAGASVINNIINSATMNRQPQVVVQQAPQQVFVQAPVQQIPGVFTIPGTVYSSGPSCVMAPTGMSTEGVPVYQRFCR